MNEFITIYTHKYIEKKREKNFINGACYYYIIKNNSNRNENENHLFINLGDFIYFIYNIIFSSKFEFSILCT